MKTIPAGRQNFIIMFWMNAPPYCIRTVRTNPRHCNYLIIGASPEALVQVTNNEVTTNPIAGTRPRGNNIVEDNALAKELLADPKEISEHDMLVDLSKQDLSLICESESINVPVYKQIEKYEHVMHIVSEVNGTLMENK